MLVAAADCVACHTDVKGGGAPLAGGRPLDTPFGRFFGPNITSDKHYGIGAWSEAEFRRALRDGIGREGEHLFPVFPFTSFTRMTDEDIGALYAYLQSRPAVALPNKPHELRFPFGWRFLMVFWRWLFFRAGPLAPVRGESVDWNRGRYLAEAVAHCQECHTPRNFLGALKSSRAYSGNPQGPDGLKVPNITPDPESGLGKWSVDDIATLLHTGQNSRFRFRRLRHGRGREGHGCVERRRPSRHRPLHQIAAADPYREAERGGAITQEEGVSSKITMKQ